MQVKPGTFAANMLPGHGNIMNGYDNILAGLNYAKHRYGSDLSFLGNGHGYFNGGIVSKHQVAQIAEEGAESIIPLNSLRSSRGFEMLGKTAAIMAARDGLGHQSENSGSQLDDSKIDIMIGLLTQLVAGQNNPTPAYVVASQAQNELDKFNRQRNSTNILARG